MATQLIDDLQTEAPPSKRARLEHAQDLPMTPIDDMKDICGTAAATPAPDASKALNIESTKITAVEISASKMKGIPGLGLLGLGQTPKNDQEAALGGNSI